MSIISRNHRAEGTSGGGRWRAYLPVVVAMLFPLAADVENRGGILGETVRGGVLGLASQPVWREMAIDGLSAGSTLGQIWACGAEQVFVWTTMPGTPRRAILYRWDGAAWAQSLVVDGVGGTGGVFGTGPNDIHAAVYPEVEGRPIFYRSTNVGQTWALQAVPAEVTGGGYSRISGTPGNVHTTVSIPGGSGIMRFDGAAWSIVYRGQSSFAVPNPYATHVFAPNEAYFST